MIRYSSGSRSDPGRWETNWNRSYELPLSEGMLFERRVFHSMFATEDQKEGMSAFLEKRAAQFRDK